MQIEDKKLLIIPTYNCENQITRVLNQIESSSLDVFHEIVIIDNRSNDKTIERAKDYILEKSLPIRIQINNQNNNLGGTLKNAFNYAIASNFAYIGVIHGDDQGNPNDLKLFMDNHMNADFDLAIGSRFKKESNLIGYSIIRNLGNRVVNIFASLIMRARIEDLIAGVNLYKVDFLRKIPFQVFPNNLTFDAHLLFSSVINGARIQYFPITWKDEDQISNAKIFKQGFLIIQTLIKSKSRHSVLRSKPDAVNKSLSWTSFL
jgi:glycosyltransferase involved in cell wall biosynthesis